MLETCPLAQSSQSRLTKISVSGTVFTSFASTIGSRSAFNLEKDMIKPPTTLTRRSAFRAGAGLAVAPIGTPMLAPPSAQAGSVPHAGAEPPNRGGFDPLHLPGLPAALISACPCPLTYPPVHPLYR